MKVEDIKTIVKEIEKHENLKIIQFKVKDDMGCVTFKIANINAPNNYCKHYCHTKISISGHGDRIMIMIDDNYNRDDYNSYSVNIALWTINDHLNSYEKKEYPSTYKFMDSKNMHEYINKVLHDESNEIKKKQQKQHDKETKECESLCDYYRKQLNSDNEDNDTIRVHQNEIRKKLKSCEETLSNMKVN